MGRSTSVLLLSDFLDHRLQLGVARYARQASWHMALAPVFRDEMPWGWRGDGYRRCARSQNGRNSEHD